MMSTMLFVVGTFEYEKFKFNVNQLYKGVYTAQLSDRRYTELADFSANQWSNASADRLPKALLNFKILF